MEDRRRLILDKCVDAHLFLGLGAEEEKIALDAMDRYMEWCCLELLQFLADNAVEISCNNSIAELTQEQVFYYKGEWITKEQLFENFL